MYIELLTWAYTVGSKPNFFQLSFEPSLDFVLSSSSRAQIFEARGARSELRFNNFPVEPKHIWSRFGELTPLAPPTQLRHLPLTTVGNLSLSSWPFFLSSSFSCALLRLMLSSPEHNCSNHLLKNNDKALNTRDKWRLIRTTNVATSWDGFWTCYIYIVPEPWFCIWGCGHTS